MRIVSLVIVSSGLLLAACRGGSNKGVDAAGDASSVVKIQDVQSDNMMPGTPVTLEGVVVTAVDTYGVRTGDFWVEEPEGGAMSGIHVFGADPAVSTTLQPGDVVTVTNCIKSSFALASDMSGRTENELAPPMKGATVTVVKTGSGTVPMPSTVDALAIGRMADPDRSMQWKMWDGVLVTVTNVSETSAVKQVPSSKNPDPLLQEFGITGVALVESDLAAFPTSGLGFNACLSSVTGVVNYFFDYQILNRSAADIVVAGATTACPAPENTMTLCGDTIDNDGNGFSDCLDNNCIVGVAACRSTTNISEIDAAADNNPATPAFPTGTPTMPGVELGNGSNTDVYVTAVAMNGHDFWVSTNRTAGADGGLYVFASGQTFVSSADVGKTVHVVGTLKGYNNDSQGLALAEFQALSVDSLSANAQALVPVATQTANSLSCGSAATPCVPDTGHPFIGSLVTLTFVQVTTANDPANHNIGTLTQTKNCTGSCAFEVEADTMMVGAANTCYTSITGIWTYDVYNNVYALEPTSLTMGTGC